MAFTHHTGIPRPLNAGCSPRVIISVSNNPFCLGSSVTFTPTITCLETAQIASYAWIVNGDIVSTSGDPYITTELTNNDSVYLLVIGTNGVSYFSNVIYMVVTNEGCITDIKYGLLYNWYAATDARKITSSDTWHVPDYNNDYNTLKTYLGGSAAVSGKLKETGYTYWNSPNTNATNVMNFNSRGTGLRHGATGFYEYFKEQGGFWMSEYTTPGSTYILILYYNSQYTGVTNNPKNGFPIRIVRTATAEEQLLADGTACAPYTGNDGKNYRTVKIGTQVWLADNLAETKFRNGDYLHGYEGGSYQAISDANWSALTSEGVCCYNDDINLI